jgi:hypothetical protein
MLLPPDKMSRFLAIFDKTKHERMGDSSHPRFVSQRTRSAGCPNEQPLRARPVGRGAPLPRQLVERRGQDRLYSIQHELRSTAIFLLGTVRADHNKASIKTVKASK